MNNIENIELFNEEKSILQEKRELKLSFTNLFFEELSLLLEKCFLLPKKKKEHFITKEKLEVEILRLLQSQKKFTSLKSVKEDLKSLFVYDNEKNIIGKILSIDLVNENVEYQTLFLDIQIKSFKQVSFFDMNTIQLVSAFDKQKLYSDLFTYKDTYRFLMSDKKTQPSKKIKETSGEKYGRENYTTLKINDNIILG